jgi:hypothetical protein
MAKRSKNNKKHFFLKGDTPWNKGKQFQNNEDSQCSSMKTVRLSTAMHEKVINTSCIGVEPVLQEQVSQFRFLGPKRCSVDSKDEFCAEAENYR